MRKRIQKKLIRKKAGFTMTEMLCVTIILVLVSSCLTLGIDLCNKSLNSTKQFSEMQMLSSTLAMSISDELRYAKDITISGDTISFLSDRHGTGTSFLVDANGQIVLTRTSGSDYPLLSSSAYFGSRIDNLKFTYNPENKIVNVSFAIKNSGTIKETTFEVKTLNA